MEREGTPPEQRFLFRGEVTRVPNGKMDTLEPGREISGDI